MKFERVERKLKFFPTTLENSVCAYRHVCTQAYSHVKSVCVATEEMC